MRELWIELEKYRADEEFVHNACCFVFRNAKIAKKKKKCHTWEGAAQYVPAIVCKPGLSVSFLLDFFESVVIEKDDNFAYMSFVIRRLLYIFLGE